MKLFAFVFAFITSYCCFSQDVGTEKLKSSGKILITLDSLISNEYTDDSQFLSDLKLVSIEDISFDELKSFVERQYDYMILGLVRDLINIRILDLRDSEASSRNHHLVIKDLKNYRRMVDDHMNLIVENDYLHYSVQETSRTPFKSFHVYHDNDVLLFPPGKNADRDYTGGFRFEVTTDFLKMRLFRLFGNPQKYLSYQSMFFGGEGYTPYIRFTKEELVERNILYEEDPITKFLTSASLDSIQNYMRSNQRLTDRPFASYQYIGRGKYRLHCSGNFRIASFFKIGIVGGQIGKSIQAVLHQDFTVGSQRVLNWEDQIANGGRLGINVEHNADISLFSINSLYTSLNKNEPDWILPLLENINIYSPLELAFGTVHTHFGLGLGISSKGFEKTSGINDVKPVMYPNISFWEKLWKNSYIGIEYKYRRVVHNSMLEGVGFINAWKDDPLDDEALTVYKLREEDIQRNLHILRFQIAFRLNRISLFYRQLRYMTKEFEVKDADATYSEFQTPNWYGYGQIGFNFMIAE